MAAGWIHQTHDLIVFGRTYGHVHGRKDAPSQRAPGKRHRATGHEWYQRFGAEWNFERPFPEAVSDVIRKIRESSGAEAAEERMSSDGHDLLDRVWDDLSKERRLYCEGLFAWLVYRPEHLERWAGVDVVRGRIERVLEGELVWEDSTATVTEYKSLRRNVSRHHKWRLRDVLARYG